MNQPYQQQPQGYQQQGGYQQGGQPQPQTDTGVITKVYENRRDDGSISYAIILDEDKNRRYTTKHRPSPEGSQVQVTYVARGRGKYINRLDTLGQAQQSPAQQGYGQPVQQAGHPQPGPAQGITHSTQQYDQQAPAARRREGVQVGNALNNAATILGAGATVAQLEATAFAILEVADRLAVGDTSRINAAAGNVGGPVTQQAQAGYPQGAPQGAAPQGPSSFDDDVPW